jgi:hypothetical protein
VVREALAMNVAGIEASGSSFECEKGRFLNGKEHQLKKLILDSFSNRF